MQKRTVVSVVIASAIVVALGACSSGPIDDGGSDDGSISIGVVSGSASNPAVQVMNDAIEAQAKASGVEVFVETSESVDEQIQKADTLIARGIDYLGIHPWDGAAVIPLINSAQAQGIKVIILVDGVPDVVEDGKALTFVSGNEVAAATELGKIVADAVDGPTEAGIITGSPGNLSAENRTAGFTAGVEGTDVSIVSENTGNWARDEALQVAGDMLTANPDLGVIFANNDEMALGAVAAVKEAGREGDVDIIGWNGTCVGLQALLDGEFYALAYLPFGDIGTSLVTTAVADAAGESVPAQVEPEVPILTLDTAKAILDGSQKASESLLADLTAAQSGC